MTKDDFLKALDGIDEKYVKSIGVFYRTTPSWRYIMKKTVKYAAITAAAVLTIGVIALFMALQNRPETGTTGTTDSIYDSANDINLEKPLVEDPRPISCDTEMDGEPVTILTEKRFEEAAKELKRCYNLLQEGEYPNILFKFLPEDTAARETMVTNLKTEIMAGKGPDAFLLNAQATLGDDPKPFFADPESAMRSNLFLPLNDLINESDIINMSNLNTTVFDAGKVGNVQYLMPLLYTFGISVVNADDLVADELPSTWQEVLDCEDEKLKSTVMNSAFSFPGNTFSSLVDYGNNRLTFSQEELLKLFQEITGRTEKPYENIADSSRFSDTTLYFLKESQVKDRAFLPLPNEDGGVTASVKAYAAVNANSKHPRAAFSVLETLFRLELLTYDGITRMDNSSDPPYPVHYGSNFYCSGMMTLAEGISVMDKAFIDSCDIEISQEDRQALKQCFEKIDRARIVSQLDSELSYALMQILGANANLDDTVAEAYAAMQMMLAES